MKCTNRNRIILLLFAVLFVMTGCKKEEIDVPYGYLAGNDDYTLNSDINASNTKLFAEDLCATDVDITNTSAIDSAAIMGAGVYDLNDRKVLYSYNANTHLNPASLTKIMTALIVIENCDLNSEVTVSDVTINEPGSQLFGLHEGDRISVMNLLYATLVYSGNDAALALAKYVGETEEGFAEMMNNRARELGCVGTNFVNSNGLTNENHYTTVYDLYLIFNEAVKHQEFIDIVNTVSKDLSYTSASGEIVNKTINTTNKFLTGDYNAPGTISIVGGKTGSTSAAGKCLIVYGKDQFENPYISCILGASDEQALYNTMINLVEQSMKSN